MTNNGHTPTYESFLNTPFKGRNIKFIESLEPGVPTRYEGTGVSSNARPMLWKVAKRAGIPIASRIVDNELWVVRLKPEDVPA